MSIASVLPTAQSYKCGSMLIQANVYLDISLQQYTTASVAQCSWEHTSNAGGCLKIQSKVYDLKLESRTGLICPET